MLATFWLQRDSNFARQLPRFGLHFARVPALISLFLRTGVSRKPAEHRDLAYPKVYAAVDFREAGSRYHVPKRDVQYTARPQDHKPVSTRFEKRGTSRCSQNICSNERCIQASMLNHGCSARQRTIAMDVAGPPSALHAYRPNPSVPGWNRVHNPLTKRSPNPSVPESCCRFTTIVMKLPTGRSSKTGTKAVTAQSGGFRSDQMTRCAARHR
nr:hypothetical protein CFP56_62471 [Quercus suber]